MCEKYPFQKKQFDFIPDLVDKNKVLHKIVFKEEKIYKCFGKKIKRRRRRIC